MEPPVQGGQPDADAFGATVVVGAAPAGPSPPGSATVDGTRPEDNRGAPADVDRRRRLATSAAQGRARRSWRRYGAVLGVFLLILAGFVFGVWRTSEIRAVHSHPTKVKGHELSSGAVPATLHQLWHTTDRLAQGQPVYLDVAVTYSEHAVVGRDATTGAVRWSYSRSDRSVCAVSVDGDTVIAIYRHDGNCDELTGLDAESGRRDWARTQFEDGTPTVQSIPQFLLQVTPLTVHLLSVGSIDFWNYPQPTGCRTTAAALGTAGVLYGTNCATASTLSFRIGSGPKNTSNAWSQPLDGRTPLSADGVITALSSDRRSIQVLDTKTGKVDTTIPLASPVSAPSVPSAQLSDDGNVELISTSGSLLAIPGTSPTKAIWQRPTTGTPADTSAGLLFPASGKVIVVNAPTGRVLRAIPAPGLAATATIYPRGRGLVTTTPAGTVAWA